MKLNLLLFIFLSSALMADDSDLLVGVPATYSLWLKKTHPLYSFAPEGPCGASITLRGNKMPVQVAGLNFGSILEISKDNKTVTEWPAPMDSSPVSINGENLLIHIFESDNNYVYVTKAGDISVAFDTPSNSIAIHECPDVEGKPHISQYLICRTLTDKKSNKRRVFAWARSCT